MEPEDKPTMTLRQHAESLGYSVVDFDNDIDKMHRCIYHHLEALRLENDDLRERLKAAKQALEGSF
jgi:regulator of replication initiation timing